MPRLGNFCDRGRVIRALRRAGLRDEPGGRHTIITDEHGNFRSTVPNHRRINHNTLRAILKQCGLGVEEFMRLY
jgi:predicted RNA binding protein YcfA (HicA-like mRNA interferase family)